MIANSNHEFWSAKRQSYINYRLSRRLLAKAENGSWTAKSNSYTYYQLNRRMFASSKARILDGEEFPIRRGAHWIVRKCDCALDEVMAKWAPLFLGGAKALLRGQGGIWVNGYFWGVLWASCGDGILLCVSLSPIINKLVLTKPVMELASSSVLAWYPGPNAKGRGNGERKNEKLCYLIPLEWVDGSLRGFMSQLWRWLPPLC